MISPLSSERKKVDELPAPVEAPNLDFILAVNAGRHSDLDAASDACSSISDHLQLVERRLLRLAVLDPQAPHAADARRFVFTRLRPTSRRPMQGSWRLQCYQRSDWA